MSLDPLRLSYEIACPADHAFDVWTTRLASWWPPGHSASGVPGTRVQLEPHLGGRIFERTPDGTEIDWGRITVWQPPHRLGYAWHIGRPSTEATEVELTFVEVGDGTTRLEIVQSGWDRLGDDAISFRQANQHGWSALIGPFTEAAEAG